MIQTAPKDIVKYRLWAFLIVFFGACSRIWGGGADSFWLDEVLTLRTVNGGWTVALGLEDHPPLMYWIATAITNLTVESEFTLRFVSIIGGIIAIPLIVEFGRFFLDRTSGLLAGLLLALSPFHLRYAHEARHYALMLALTLSATYFMCRAISTSKNKNSRAWWVGFAVVSALSMYTHYAACLVFVAHCVLIGFVWIRNWLQSKTLELWPVGAIGLAGLLYLPWLIRLYRSVTSNLQPAADIFEQASIAGLADWLTQTAIAFGYSNHTTAVFMVLLFGTGLMLLWVHKKRFQAFVFVSIIVIPFGFIVGLQVARAPLPKYVIFMLPSFLLSISYAITVGIQMLARAQRSRQRLLIGGVGLAVLVFGAESLRAEYVREERGWSTALAQWEAVAADGDVIIRLNLDLGNGYNQGLVVAPLYLSEQNAVIELIDGNFLQPEIIEALPADANLWGLIIDRHPPYPDQAENLDVQKFQGELYLVRLTDQSSSTFDQLGELLNTFVPLTTVPSPVCLMHQNIAAHHFVARRFEQVLAEFDIANSLCPTPPRDSTAWDELETETQYLLLDQYQAEGNQTAVQKIAFDLLVKDQKDQRALAALTYFDVLSAIQAQSNQVAVQNISEPNAVDLRRFTMPQNGDWGDVVFLHPPNQLVISLDLPESPTNFVSRLAMAPESWDWGGDGATFIVEVITEDNKAEILFEQHIDNQPQNRRWHDIVTTLAPYAGQSVKLILRTEFGEAQNDVGDWAGWESPRIIVVEPTLE